MRSTLVWDSRIRSTSLERARSAIHEPGSPDPAYRHRATLPSFAINVRGNYLYLVYDGWQTISNTTINLGDDNTYGNELYVGVADETLTLAASTTVNLYFGGNSIVGNFDDDQALNLGVINANSSSGGGANGLGGADFVNQGTINVKNADNSLTVNFTSFTNSGLIDIAGGGYFTINPATFTNLASRKLTGGTYEVDAGSTLQLYTTSATTIQTLAANVILNGSGSTFTQYLTNTGGSATLESSLRTIAATGELQLFGARTWTTSGAAITNDGTINLGGGSVVATASGASLTDAAGSHLMGYGVVNATSFANAGTIEAKGGTLTLQNTVTARA